MPRSLNIAHCVEFYRPSIGGMQEVVKQLSERMVRAGHKVTVFTTHLPERTSDMINGVRIRGFKAQGNTVRGITGEAEAYRKALIEGGFDVVTFFAAQQWTTDAMLPHLSELKAAKVFVPTGFSALHVTEYAEYYARMPEWLRAMDLNVFLSTQYQDISFARQHGITSITMIPNGAAEEEFAGPLRHDVRAELGIASGEPLILHVGSFTGSKGHLEAIEIFLRARRTRRSTLLFIGDGVKEAERTHQGHRRMTLLKWNAALTQRRILFRELDRPRTVAAMRQADLFLFPSNVECSPIVLFETMAAGTPFLASNAGNSAEIAQWSGSGWILPGKQTRPGWEVVDIAGSVKELDRLLSEPELLRAKGLAGIKVWKERFTWRHISDLYAAEYERLANARP